MFWKIEAAVTVCPSGNLQAGKPRKAFPSGKPRKNISQRTLFVSVTGDGENVVSFLALYSTPFCQEKRIFRGGFGMFWVCTVRKIRKGNFQLENQKGIFNWKTKREFSSGNQERNFLRLRPDLRRQGFSRSFFGIKTSFSRAKVFFVVDSAEVGVAKRAITEQIANRARKVTGNPKPKR